MDLFVNRETLRRVKEGLDPEGIACRSGKRFNHRQ